MLATREQQTPRRARQPANQAAQEWRQIEAAMQMLEPGFPGQDVVFLGRPELWYQVASRVYALKAKRLGR